MNICYFCEKNKTNIEALCDQCLKTYLEEYYDILCRSRK